MSSIEMWWYPCEAKSSSAIARSWARRASRGMRVRAAAGGAAASRVCPLAPVMGGGYGNPSSCRPRVARSGTMGACLTDNPSRTGPRRPARPARHGVCCTGPPSPRASSSGSAGAPRRPRCGTSRTRAARAPRRPRAGRTRRPRSPRAAGPPRGLRPGAAAAACLVLGCGGGAATAEVWDVPHPRGASPEAAASRQDPPAPVREEDDAASRSAVGRAGAAASAPERAPALDLLAPRPDAITAPDPAPSAEPGMTTPEPPVAEQPPEPPVADPGSGLLGDVVVAPDLGGALAVVPGESPAPGGGTVRSVRVEVEEGLPVDGEVFATAVL